MDRSTYEKNGHWDLSSHHDDESKCQKFELEISEFETNDRLHSFDRLVEHDDYSVLDGSMQDEKLKKIQAYRSLFGGFLIHLILGAQYTWGNISIYCSSYFGGLYESPMSLVLPMIVIMTTFLMPFNNELAKKLSDQVLVATGVFVLCLGTMLASFIEPTSETAFYKFVILFGGSFGICNGLCYIVPLRICYEYFPDAKGFVSGVIIGGFGLGSFLFGFISTLLINPENRTSVDGVYDESVTKNVPLALRIFVAIWGSIALIAINFLYPIQKVEQASSNIITTPILHQTKFWLLYAMNFSSAFIGYIVVSNYKVYGSQYISDDLFLTAVGSIACVMGSLRFLWSLVLDKSTYSKVYGSLVLIQLVCGSMITHSVNNPDFYGLLVSLIVFCEGGHFVMLPAHCASVFETAEIGLRAFGYMFSCFGTSCLCGVLVQNILLYVTDEPFQWLFFVASALNVVSLILLYIYSFSQTSTDKFERVQSSEKMTGNKESFFTLKN